MDGVILKDQQLHVEGREANVFVFEKQNEHRRQPELRGSLKIGWFDGVRR